MSQQTPDHQPWCIFCRIVRGEATAEILYQDDLPLNTPGVFVYQVDRASPAGIGGLRIGDIIQEINQQEIKNFDLAKETIAGYIDGQQKMHMLKVLSNRNTRFVFIDLKK